MKNQKYFSQIKLGCIVIFTTTLKLFLTELLKKIYDALAWTLRNSIKEELEFIEQTIAKVKYLILY